MNIYISEIRYIFYDLSESVYSAIHIKCGKKIFLCSEFDYSLHDDSF